MNSRTLKSTARYFIAIFVVAIFVFPIAWFALTSIKPISAVFNKDRVVVFDFQPTFENYRVTVLGGRKSDSRNNTSLLMGTSGEGAYDGRGATSIALLAAYALSRLSFRGAQGYMHWILSQRFLPPIAIIIPLVFIFRDLGIRDTHLGLILAHTLINIPIALLILKSFFDDVPIEVDQAAMIDGATRFQCFYLVVLPMIKGGVAATAVLCFIFSWTEFLLSLFLTNSIRTVPVKITTFVTSTGSEWGYISALGTAAIVPGFIFILLVQNHLVRGLTMGAVKD